MVGIDVPVEPRKRYSWVFKAEQPLDQDLPLTIDPSGVHFRENGSGTYQAGGHSDIDPAVDYDDFTMDHDLWQNHVWPIIATRVPQFEAIKVQSEWAGHYAYNVLDQNAILGAHPDVRNFHFINGFSGHGLQHRQRWDAASPNGSLTANIAAWIYRFLALSASSPTNRLLKRP